jgi:hypothetical protein
MACYLKVPTVRLIDSRRADPPVPWLAARAKIADAFLALMFVSQPKWTSRVRAS